MERFTRYRSRCGTMQAMREYAVRLTLTLVRGLISFLH
jgi:hypothetical protein